LGLSSPGGRRCPGGPPNDSDYDHLPLGRMETREARHGQERRFRRTDGGARKRTVVETVGPERDHEESGNIGERAQTAELCVGLGETDHPLGDTAMGPVQGSGIQTRRWGAFLVKVPNDLEDLGGIGDYCDELQGSVTSRAAQGAPAVLRAPSGRWASCRPWGPLHRSS